MFDNLFEQSFFYYIHKSVTPRFMLLHLNVLETQENRSQAVFLLAASSKMKFMFINAYEFLNISCRLKLVT